MPEIETANKYLVGSHGERVTIMRQPILAMSHDDALNLAAYLVSMSDGFGTHPFEEVLKAVQNT